MPWGGYGGDWDDAFDYDEMAIGGRPSGRFGSFTFPKPFNPETDMVAPGNAIHQIQLYKNYNAWVFDDDLRGLYAEPFVQGATELINYHLRLKGLEKKENPVLQFSLEYIPNADVILTNTAKHGSKSWNPTTKTFTEIAGEATSGDFVDQYGNQCWLCPAQVRFFGRVPDNIYCIIK